MAKKLKTTCPHCQSNWGVEEASFQECDSCGYPHQDDFSEESDLGPTGHGDICMSDADPGL